MSVAISSLITTAIVLLVMFGLARELVTTHAKLSDSWADRQRSMEERSRTKINAPHGQWVGEEETIKVTVTNAGEVPLAQFEDWDLVLEIQKDPGLGIAYLTYTTTTPPGTNEWTVDGIYRDASTLEPEGGGPGILDPGEEMVVLVKPNPAVVLSTADRAMFSTPNGATATVIFEVVVTPTP